MAVSRSELIDRVIKPYLDYGADLIRTACVMVHCSTTVMYRACFLWHRYHENIRQWLNDETLAIVLPENYPPGYPPAAFKPQSLSQLVNELETTSEVAFLAAACVVVASKMEQSEIKMRPIMNAFERLDRRRRKIPILSAEPIVGEEYEAFKSEVLRFEKSLLFTTSFSTLVEYPHKYVALLIPELVGEVSPDGRVATARWLCGAISVCNDFSRCGLRVMELPAPLLAAVALEGSRPSDVTLPDDWTIILGYDAAKVVETKAMCEKAMDMTPKSAKVAVTEALQTLVNNPNGIPAPPVYVPVAAAAPPPPPPKVTEFEEFVPKSKRDKKDKKKDKKDKADKKRKREDEGAGSKGDKNASEDEDLRTARTRKEGESATDD